MSIGRVPGVTGIQPSIVDAKGDLIVATAADSVDRLAVGANEQRLVADSATATGLKYVADTTNYAIAAKGDLLVGTAADTLAALTVGTNGHTLVADSSTATGLKWASASSGGMTLISTTSLSGASITLSSIPGTYKNLYIVVRDYTFAASTGGYLYFQMNGDATSNLHREIVMTGNTTTAQTLAYQGTDFRNRNIEVGFNPQENAATLTVFDYANTSAHKIVEFNYFYYGNDGNDHIETGSGGYMSTSAITSIKIGGSAGTFDAGSVLFYGVN